MIISEEKSCRITLPCERNPKPGARLLAGSNNNFEKHTGSLIMILKAVLRPCMTHECSLSAQLPIYQCNNSSVEQVQTVSKKTSLGASFMTQQNNVRIAVALLVTSVKWQIIT